MSLLPDLEGLRLLRDVARLGSIGSAGRAAGISQQSASERLRAMETQTGLTLVRRARSGSSLTPAGQLVVEWSARLLEQADQVETALHTLRGDRRRELRVWASMTTAEYLLPGWLVGLRDADSSTGTADETAVSLRATNSETVLAGVRDGGADLGFIESAGDLTGLASQVVGHDTLLLVTAPADPLALRRTPLTVAAAARLRVTSRERGSGTRQVVEDAFASHGHTPPAPAVELTTTAAVLAAVRAGSAPAFVSELAARAEVDAGRLVAVPVRGLDLSRAFAAVWVGGQRPPAGPLRDLLAIATRGGR